MMFLLKFKNRSIFSYDMDMRYVSVQQQQQSPVKVDINDDINAFDLDDDDLRL